MVLDEVLNVENLIGSIQIQIQIQRYLFIVDFFMRYKKNKDAYSPPVNPGRINPTNIFACIRVGVPVARLGTVADKVAAYLHPAALQQPSGGHHRGWLRGGQPPLSSQWYNAGSRPCAEGVGRVVASDGQLEAKTSQTENQ